jgi:ribonuclease I
LQLSPWWQLQDPSIANTLIVRAGNWQRWGASRGDFSIFLLRTEWAPEWCCRGSSSFCTPSGLTTKLVDDTDPPEWEHISAERLILHGMWPEWDDATGNRSTTVGSTTYHNLYWPQYCNGTGMQNDSAPVPTADFGPCFLCDAQGQHCHDSEAPECKLPESARTGRIDELQALAPAYLSPNTLGDHEWMKHGSCSKLLAHEYITDALYIFNSLLLAEENDEAPILEDAAANGATPRELSLSLQI